MFNIYQEIIKFYHNKGYKIALTEYDLDEQWDVLFPYLSMIKVDIEKVNPKRLQPVVQRIKPFNIKLAAEKVETVEIITFSIIISFVMN